MAVQPDTVELPTEPMSLELVRSDLLSQVVRILERDYDDPDRFLIGIQYANWNGTGAHFHIVHRVDGATFRLTIRADGSHYQTEYQRS